MSKEIHWRKNFIIELENLNYEKAKAILFSQATGKRNTPNTATKMQAINIIRKFYNGEAKLIRNFLDSISNFTDDTSLEIVCTLLVDVYHIDPIKTSHKLHKLADCPSWEVREWVASACGEILNNHFESFYPILFSWTNDTSANIRRTASVAAMYAGKSRRKEYAPHLLDLVENLLSDKDTYVKKNLGPFTIGDGLLRYYPNEVMDRLNLWIDMDDENVRWNIAKVFSTAEGIKYIEKGEHIIQVLLDDKRLVVKRAVNSMINNIKKKNPNLLNLLKIE